MDDSLYAKLFLAGFIAGVRCTDVTEFNGDYLDHGAEDDFQAECRLRCESEYPTTQLMLEAADETEI